MAIQTYTCDCGHITEELFFQNEIVPDIYECESCHSEAKYKFPITADRREYNPYYDRNLGTYITSERQRQTIMKRKGYESLEDLNPHYIEDNITAKESKRKEQDKLFDKIEYETKKADGNKAIGLCEAMPAKDIKAGKFDDII